MKISMRSGAKVHVLLALAVIVSACASAPAVPVRGNPSEIAGIAGEWDGTYSSRATGRSGSIWFKLIEGEDHAHGDVMITGAGATSPFRRYVPERYPYLQGPRPSASPRYPIPFSRSASCARRTAASTASSTPTGIPPAPAR